MIPKVLRDQLGILPGDEVVVNLDGVGVRVLPAVREDGSLMGSLQGLDLIATLEEEHRRERRR